MRISTLEHIDLFSQTQGYQTQKRLNLRYTQTVVFDPQNISMLQLRRRLEQCETNTIHIDGMKGARLDDKCVRIGK